ncbi:XdhC family protein [Heyndrickxia sp. NPDC080065]|uniref:XdhC family protein n=1 Tax=Heyndrickxia sp. NPDC080065 TaxID=3390568 RepID=UPI003CFFC0F6
MEDIFQILNELRISNGKGVLATIIHVEGSSYKKEGSTMLFLENGEQIGMLSAGCLEEELQYKAEQVWKEQEAKVFIYNMKEESDLSWGQGAGCNGVLHILLEPITAKLQEDLLSLKGFLDAGDTVLHIKQFTEDFNLIAYGYYPLKGSEFGSSHHLIEDKHVKQRNGLLNIDGAAPMYLHLYKPKPRLFLFGAGPDAIPLANFAEDVGFEVTVCDWRPGFCNKEKFPKISNCMIGFPREICEELSFRKDDFVIIMTHHFQRDKELLSFLKNEKLNYLGILGPKRRTQRLLNHEEIPSWISSPVGKSIGAKGAEEIAISIVAEMIEVLRKPVKEKMWSS